MSDFKFDCPKCGQNIVCDTSNAGMQIPCPTCQAMLTVPAAPAAAPAALVPGVPATPGKLSIRHTAPAPPSAAAKAPASPVRPQLTAFAQPKKKSPLVTICVIVGLVVVLAIGWFAFGAPYLKKQADEKKQAEEAATRQAAEAKAQADADAAKVRLARAEWNLDLTGVNFPQRPASGKLHGENFTVDMASYQSGFLILRQSTGSSRQFQVAIPMKTGEKLAGKTLQVNSTDTANVPRVAMNWKEDAPKPPGTQAFTKGYALRLEIGEPADGNIPGKIYLCVPDDAQSFVAGDFEIGPRKPGPAAKRRKPATPGASPPK